MHDVLDVDMKQRTKVKFELRTSNGEEYSYLQLDVNTESLELPPSPELWQITSSP